MNIDKHQNQTHFEVIRDLIPVIGNLPEGEILTITVYKQQGSSYYSFETSRGNSYRSSELANALKKTYEEFTYR